MDGPLHPTLYDTATAVPSWWEASLPGPAERPALAGEVAADVAIIGAGYAGLAAAIRLAELGLGAVVLDAGAIGWGASGRNGGIVGFGGTKRSQAALTRLHGADAVARCRALLTENIARLRAFCGKAGLEAHVQGDGELVLAHSARAFAALAAHAEPGDVLPPAPRGDIARFGGVVERPGFGIHPLALVRALADRAEGLGARLYPRSEVRTWARAEAGHRLTTDGGAVTAGRVLLATNGFTPDRLHGAFRGRAIPVISNIAVTRPLTEAECARHPWLGDTPCADTRHLLAYFRLLPDRRLMFGMRGDAYASPAGGARLRAATIARIARDLPGFAGAEVTHFWRGPICATLRLTPAIGLLPDDPSVAHAFGWHGSGINMGTCAGRLVAEAMTSGAAIPAPWRGLPPRVPIPALRPAYVAAMMAAYTLADRLG